MFLYVTFLFNSFQQYRMRYSSLSISHTLSHILSLSASLSLSYKIYLITARKQTHLKNSKIKIRILRLYKRESEKKRKKNKQQLKRLEDNIQDGRAPNGCERNMNDYLAIFSHLWPLFHASLATIIGPSHLQHINMKLIQLKTKYNNKKKNKFSVRKKKHGP